MNNQQKLKETCDLFLTMLIAQELVESPALFDTLDAVALTKGYSIRVQRRGYEETGISSPFFVFQRREHE